MTVIRIAGGVIAAGLVVAGVALYNLFGAFLPWREAAEADRLAALAGVGSGQIIAEIGAGTGRFTAELARRVGPTGHVYSTELSAGNRAAIEARAAAAGLSHVTVVAATAAETHLPDACCDLAFMRNVYHHIQDPEDFARQVRRALRTGGRVVVTDFEPGALWLHGSRPDGAAERRSGHGVAREEAIAEFASAGFMVERDERRWSGPMWLLSFR